MSIPFEITIIADASSYGTIDATQCAASHYLAAQLYLSALIKIDYDDVNEIIKVTNPKNNQTLFYRISSERGVHLTVPPVGYLHSGVTKVGV